MYTLMALLNNVRIYLIQYASLSGLLGLPL